MAAIENSAFELKVTNHEFDSVGNISGVYYNGNNKEICAAGFLCKTGELLPLEGYAASLGITNHNTWKMGKAVAADLVSTPIYACNTYGVNELTDPSTGEIYKVNANTLGLAAPAGVVTTFSKIDFRNGCQYRFGIGNLSAELGSNKFFTIADGMLVPAAAAPNTTGQPYFELLGTGTFTQGAWSAFGYVDVLACYVAAVSTSA